ncbi:DNA topoisomerase I [Pluteus cervinus]|uniref:DNA topoisomerase I n=1 Tax=Pluteus cervinus TaxID=181527 RepID=A0ACD3BC30_9AGAR|nr:DNA topoisomerase I [Pluteus cervinus]
MSNDTTMYSDDDTPLVNKPTANGRNHNGAVNGKHATNGTHHDSPMHEDEESPPAQTNKAANSTKPLRGQKRKKAGKSESSSDEDVPLASSPRKPATKQRKPPKKRARDSSDEETKPSVSKPAASRKRKERGSNDSDDDTPIAKKAPKPRATKVKKEESEPPSKVKKETKESTSKATKATKAKKEEESEGSQLKGKGKNKDAEKEEDDEEVFKWWEGDVDGDGSVKWQTLEHNGVIFPLPYEPLPSHVKMKYDGKEVTLPSAAEEVAGFYGAMLETPHAQDKTFNENFFDGWKGVLKDHPPRNGIKITKFELCDFRPMFEYFEAEKAKKKALSTQEKKELKKAKDDLEAPYTTCLLDGRKEKVGNFRVEPPGLFRGRGDHPKKGALKHRVRPEDITINIGKDAKIPVPNVPGKWKAVQHDNTVTWLANWTENVNGNHKYVFLAAGSSLKGQSDMSKFEKARQLKEHVDRIRQNYRADLKSKIMADRQRATAMYFIDKLALRAGNEKGEDEADTVGCCSLRCEHVTLEAPDAIIFDFLGKDSIRYYNQVQVETQVFKNIRIFKENKTDDDNLFDRVTTTSLNKHLNAEMKGLTAKVFRTFNASITFQQLLDEEALDGATLQEKLNAYNKANRMVAILCNHQRSVPKTYDQSMEKMRYKLLGLKYDRMKLRHALFGMDPKYKKNKKYSEDESDIDDDWIATHEAQLKAKEIEKAEKKFTKDNEKLQEEDKPALKESVLKERLEAIEEEFERLEKERGTRKATLKREKPAEKLEEGIDKLTDKIKAFKLQIDDREEGKEVALGTSKINYLDPRITAAWCKIHSVPIEKIFSKTLLTKFPWAMEAEPEWKF